MENDFPLGLIIVTTLILAVPGFLIFREVYRMARRSSFRTAYGVSLGREFVIRRAPYGSAVHFELSFPRWIFENKDGSGNKVRSGNGLTKVFSRLCDGDVVVSVESPIKMYALVVELRERGFDIPYSVEERRVLVAGRATDVRRQRNALASSSFDLYSSFEGDHRDFEFWCAELLRSQGWTAEVTVASNDGGVDVFLERAGETGVVECKLYGEGNTVGRPLLQKLIGAKAAHRADLAVFMTTSRFTAQAKTYAQDQGIVLLDGAALAEVSAEILRVESVSSQGDDVTSVFSVDDLMSFYPKDIASPAQEHAVRRAAAQSARARNGAVVASLLTTRRRRRKRWF